ncbi:MFS transporter [Rhodobacteraceae bacterium CCMM004]|nr:MFS transporter [Rhodobacteraceae bacterium CCMM004]
MIPSRAFLRDNAPFLSVGLLLTFSSSWGQTFFISVFAGEIRAEYGLSHAGWGAIYSAGTTASALVMVWAGALTDVLRVRVLGSLTLVGLALACVAMAVSWTLWTLVVAIFLLRLAGQGMCSHIAQVAMARWFVATRGRALSVAAMGFSLGEAILPLTFVALMTVLDWRVLWVVAAVLALAALPITVRLLRLERTPQAIAAETQAVGMGGRQWSRAAMVRHWLFWCLVPAVLGPSAFNTAFFFQQVHLAEVKGWAHVELVALFPIYTLAGVAAMLVSGSLIDRIGTARLMPLYQLPLAGAFFVIGTTDSLAMAAVGLILMATTQGFNSTLPAAFWAEFYGTRYLGAIKALAAAIMVFGSALGPLLSGWLIDRGRDFPDQMVGIGVFFCAVCAVLTVAVGRARPLLPRAAEVDIVGS